MTKPLQTGLLETLEAAHALLTVPIPSDGHADPAPKVPDSMLSIDSLDNTSFQDADANATSTPKPTQTATRTWQDTASTVLCFGGLLQPQSGILVWAGTSLFLAIVLLCVSARSAFLSATAQPDVEEEVLRGDSLQGSMTAARPARH